jgi:hypothetical protein
MLFSLKITFCFDVYTLSHFAMQIQPRSQGIRSWEAKTLVDATGGKFVWACASKMSHAIEWNTRNACLQKGTIV